MTVYTEEYKGFCIVVTEDRQAHCTARYIAKSSNGSDSACGESIETAVRHLKQKMDRIDAYQEIYTRPLENNELQIQGILLCQITSLLYRPRSFAEIHLWYLSDFLMI